MDEMILKLFEAFGGWDNSPEEKAAMEAAQPVMEQVEKKLTFEEFEDFWSAAMDVGTADVQTSFVRGFRAGARLMLEILENPG